MKYVIVKKAEQNMTRADLLQARYPELSLTNIRDIYQSKVKRSKERSEAYTRAVQALQLQIEEERLASVELTHDLAALEVAAADEWLHNKD